MSNSTPLTYFSSVAGYKGEGRHKRAETRRQRQAGGVEQVETSRTYKDKGDARGRTARL